MRRHSRAVVLLILVLSLSLGGCEGDTSQAGHRASIEPPAKGALFGAYVDPPEYTETNRINAAKDFEKSVGRRLDLFHTYHTWDDPFPSRSDKYFARRGTLLLLSWAGADTRSIAEGSLDATIKQRAADIARLGQPVLLEWRWEMNRPNLRGQIHSGADYVAAWRHIHDIFVKAGATNVGWVWCPLSDRLADQDFSAYYPGDVYVDWICADGYARSPRQTFAQVFKPFLRWARRVPKPILIGEFGREEYSSGTRAPWLRDARRFVRRHRQIKALSYFESARGSSGSYSVATEPPALAALRDWMHDPYFDQEGDRR